MPRTTNYGLWYLTSSHTWTLPRYLLLFFLFFPIAIDSLYLLSLALKSYMILYRLCFFLLYKCRSTPCSPALFHFWEWGNFTWGRGSSLVFWLWMAWIWREAEENTLLYLISVCSWNYNFNACALRTDEISNFSWEYSVMWHVKTNCSRVKIFISTLVHSIYNLVWCCNHHQSSFQFYTVMVLCSDICDKSKLSSVMATTWK